MPLFKFNILTNINGTIKQENVTVGWDQISHLSMAIGGFCIFLFIVFCYIIAFACSCIQCCCFKKDGKINLKQNWIWPWDTISNYCQSGLRYYLLASFCSVTAIYLSIMLSLEYTSHCNGGKSFCWYILDILSNVCLCGIGIFPTNFHFEPFKCYCNWCSNSNRQEKKILYGFDSFIIWSFIFL